jgi:uncharacterized protein (DUF2236 family)
MLHRPVLAGVWDYSNFRSDLRGRLQRTARFIAVTTYGGPAEAEAMIRRVRQIHERVRGVLPDGTPYAASDPALLSWVHLAGASSFLDAWIRYAEPDMSIDDQNRYFYEMAKVAAALGADPIPLNRSEAQRQFEATRSRLVYDARTREVARFVLTGRIMPLVGEPARLLVTRAACDLLPPWARRMHGLTDPPFSRPLARAGVSALAHTVRWALNQPGRASQAQ